MTPLYHRRKELQELEQQERAGSSFWTDVFSEATRSRIRLVMQNGPGHVYPIAGIATNLLLQDLGKLSLYPGHTSEVDQFFKYLAECPDSMVPSVIEAFGEGYVREFQLNAQRQSFSEGRYIEESTLPLNGAYVAEIHRVLAEDRIAFEYINGEMVPFASRELHVEVVEPVLRLLATPGWERVESSYQDALAELAHGSGADAITDAGTALQEALTLLGATGSQLGKLIASAKQAGIIASHDEALLNVIDKASHWAAADRSNSGDGHNSDPAGLDDAWFTVHVVGAILLRLSSGNPR